MTAALGADRLDRDRRIVPHDLARCLVGYRDDAGLLQAGLRRPTGSHPFRRTVVTGRGSFSVYWSAPYFRAASIVARSTTRAR
ncbi:hypothetical protein ACFV98_35605 [Streptomyces violascens]|uniref:hypothetical protein n=1 Tax=Streptomyces violascens TaxID=67381 RepID=UPI00365226F2